MSFLDADDFHCPWTTRADAALRHGKFFVDIRKESYQVDGRILKFLVQGPHYARELALLSCGT